MLFFSSFFTNCKFMFRQVEAQELKSLSRVQRHQSNTFICLILFEINSYSWKVKGVVKVKRVVKINKSSFQK